MYLQVHLQLIFLTLLIELRKVQVLPLQWSLPQLKKMLHLINPPIIVTIQKVTYFQTKKLPPMNEQASMF